MAHLKKKEFAQLLADSPATVDRPPRTKPKAAALYLLELRSKQADQAAAARRKFAVTFASAK